MPFSVPIISFAPATRIRAEDVNANFAALNGASAFVGGVPTMNFDGGKLKSDGNGNIQIQGKNLSKSTLGDMLTWASATNTKVRAPTMHTFIVGSTATGATSSPAGITSIASISSAGLIVNTGGLILGQGSISRVSVFSGSSGGIYNHGNNGVPTMCCPMQSVSGNPAEATGYDSAGPSTVHITIALGNQFTCFCLGV